jgi:cytochrome c oxidase accessory protein FixG
VNAMAPKPASTDHQPARDEALLGVLAPSLYADHVKVYPRSVQGRFRTIKWAVLSLCLVVYYSLPWLRWDRGAGAPDQALLLDMSGPRGYFFNIEIWPQEVYYITGLLILGALALFLATALFGRVWCGYTCPQTVWTDLFLAVERWIEGDRNARMRLDAQPVSAAKVLRKVAKHAVWLLIAAATGGAWIMYFVDAPTVTREIVTGGASLATYFFFGLFTLTTYVLAGWAREQVCTYMCPWPRFQAAMQDEHSLIVTYQSWRGEARGKHKAGESWEGRGDCIDCQACVHVCPTGIDIRNGPQLECIGCALCIDACDEMMTRAGSPPRPGGLRDPGQPRGQHRGDESHAAEPHALFHRHGGAPRAALHPAAHHALCRHAAAVMAVMLGAFLLRETVTLSVLRDRAPLFVTLSDGAVRNGYTLKIANKDRDVSTLTLELVAPQPLQVAVQEGVAMGNNRFGVTTRPDGITQWRVLVTRPEGLPARESMDVTFRLLDARGHVVASSHSVFLGPRP